MNRKRLGRDDFNRMNDSTCEVHYKDGFWVLSNGKYKARLMSIETLIIYANIHRIKIKNKNNIPLNSQLRLKY